MFRSLFKLFLLLNLGVFAAFAAIDHVLIPAYHQQLSESERKEVGSYAFLLTGYLARHSGPAREAALQTLRRNAREGFAVVGMHAVAHLGERRLRDLRDLRDDKIVFGDDGDDAYLPLRDGQVLHISQRNASQARIELIAYTLIASATLLAVIGWLFYHWRELNALREAARQFGRGNLAARARLSRRANLYPLTRQFNDMASRIEASVMQQREMIHGISHELKTPITRLEFGIALLQSADARPDPPQRAQGLEALRLDVRELDALAHGGQASLDSGVAGCTRFTITLPTRYLAPVPVPPCPARRD